MNASDLTWHYQNHLLALLSEADFLHLAPLLTLHEVGLKERLVAQGGPVRHVDFPCNCVYSAIIGMSDGSMAEIGTVGNEGVTNFSAFLHGRIATATQICQIPGLSLRMGIADFQWEAEHHPRLRLVLQLYGQAYLAQMELSVACNKLHTLEQRAARWLLMTHDRVGQNEFSLTHELLAIMLGAQRPTVTLIARKFEAAGALTYTRGRMRILQRSSLEAASCECYAASRRHFERLLGVRAG